MDWTAISDMLDVTDKGIAALDRADGLLQKISGRFGKGDKADVEMTLLVSDLAKQLMEARMSQLEQLRRLEKLESEAKLADRFEQTRALYATVKLPGGGLVLRLRAPDASGRHFETVCPHCVEQRQQYHPLQPQGRLLSCFNCDRTFENEPRGDAVRYGPISKDIR